MSELKTSAEIAMKKPAILYHPNVIPPMSDPRGKHWDQPERSSITIDDKHAMMSQATFDKLHEYSCSIPTGVYPGKMWKCHVGVYDPKCKPEDRYWTLIWFGYAKDGIEDKCSNNYRKILVV